MNDPNQPTEEHFKQISELWEVSNPEFIRRVENYVYRARLRGQTVILRLTEPSHRSLEEIEAELHWLESLSASGIQVAGPIRSLDQSLVKTVATERQFHVSVFHFAPGTSVYKSEHYTEDLLFSWGQYIAKLHNHSQNYQPPQSLTPRCDWSADSGYQLALSSLDPEAHAPFTRFQQFIDWLNNLDRCPQSFGLVHGDLHSGNFFVQDREITAFDFDDSSYHWFAYDLAVPLFNLKKQSEDDFFELSWSQIKASYFAGYESERDLPAAWKSRVDLFMLFRTCTVYHWILAVQKQRHLSESAQSWCRMMIPWCLEKLTPVPDFC